MTLGAKLAQLGPQPIQVEFEENDSRTVLVESVHVRDERVVAIVKTEIKDVTTYARIVGEMSDDELALQFPNKPARVESLEELVEADEMYDTSDYVVDVESGLND